MKKLFENITGNSFKLLSEAREISEGLVASGVKKVFMNSGNAPISYNRIECVGLGYIKDVNTAKKVALQEARELMKEFGYKDSEDESRFVKDSANTRPIKENDFSKLSAENPEHSLAKRSSDEPSHDETDMSNPEEKREVQIGKALLTIAAHENKRVLPGGTNSWEKVQKLAQELIQMHGQI